MSSQLIPDDDDIRLIYLKIGKESWKRPLTRSVNLRQDHRRPSSVPLTSYASWIGSVTFSYQQCYVTDCVGYCSNVFDLNELVLFSSLHWIWIKGKEEEEENGRQTLGRPLVRVLSTPYSSCLWNPRSIYNLSCRPLITPSPFPFCILDPFPSILHIQPFNPTIVTVNRLLYRDVTISFSFWSRKSSIC